MIELILIISVPAILALGVWQEIEWRRRHSFLELEPPSPSGNTPKGGTTVKQVEGQTRVGPFIQVRSLATEPAPGHVRQRLRLHRDHLTYERERPPGPPPSRGSATSPERDGTDGHVEVEAACNVRPIMGRAH